MAAFGVIKRNDLIRWYTVLPDFYHKLIRKVLIEISLKLYNSEIHKRDKPIKLDKENHIKILVFHNLLMELITTVIYLDNAATTKMDDAVLKKMIPYLTTEYGNPGTIYPLGRRALDAVTEAREKVASFIGAKPDQIIFTSGGSESNNLVIKGLYSSDYNDYSKHQILTTPIEHDSIRRAIWSVENRANSDIVRFLTINKSGVLKSEFPDDLDLDDVDLVSAMLMNNETGLENDLSFIKKAKKNHRFLFHTDCVQAAGVIPLDVDDIGCDFMSISSHKLHGPKGVGALYVRDKTLLDPIISGGLAQEFGLRGGTENVAGIVGFGEACAITQELFDLKKNTYSDIMNLFLCRLSDRLIRLGIEDTFHLNGDKKYNPGKTISIRFSGVDSETLVLALAQAGVYVSSGSACTSHESVPSHVLTSIGLSNDEARETIRVSFSRYITAYDIDSAANMIANTVYLLSSGKI